MTTPAAAGHASLISATLGDYEVLGLIGRGAMGTVYLARDVKLNRRVALKVLLGNVARNPSSVKRFHMEAQAAAPLRHPNIVRVYSAGVESGTPYIAMEYVEGEPLDRFLRRKGTIQWQNALHIAGQVAEALDCAHAHGVVHRDVKPANIMLDRQGRVRLTDFGIANVQSDDMDFPEQGGMLGTPQYMSPEQCASHTVGASSDLFSLGVTLYQMLTGKMPFSGDSATALIKSIATDDPPRVNKIIHAIPDDVTRLVAYLLEKNPKNRPADARAVCQLIARVQSEKGGHSAVPEALLSFIKEQAQPRALTFVTPPPAKKANAVREKRGFPKRLIAMTGIAALMACAAAAPSLWESARRNASAGVAPTLDSARFIKAGPGSLIMKLDSDALQFSDLAWVADKPVVLAHAEGLPGSLMQGAHGMLAIDPDAQSCTSLRSPVSPASIEKDEILPPTPCSVPVAPADTPLADSILWQTNTKGSSGSIQGNTLVLAQQYDTATPSPAILWQAQTNAPLVSNADPWTAPLIGSPIPSPDGHTICIVEADQAKRINWLVERDVAHKPLDKTGPRLTSGRAPVLSSSIQYSPDGKKLLYLCGSTRTDRELRVVRSGGGEVDGILLAMGVIGPAAAFSPDGNTIAFTRESREPGHSEICLISTSAGSDEVRLGPGRIGREPYHPSGRFLIAVANDVRAVEPMSTISGQVWAIETRAPYRRRPLTSLQEGVKEGAAVSRDGMWAVAATDGAIPPGLVFVDLRRVSFDSQT